MRSGDYADAFDDGALVGTLSDWELIYKTQAKWTARARSFTSDTLSRDRLPPDPLTIFFIPRSPLMEYFVAVGMGIIQYEADTDKYTVTGVGSIRPEIRDRARTRIRRRQDE
jgi:hypothetical protein